MVTALGNLEEEIIKLTDSRQFRNRGLKDLTQLSFLLVVNIIILLSFKILLSFNTSSSSLVSTQNHLHLLNVSIMSVSPRNLHFPPCGGSFF